MLRGIRSGAGVRDGLEGVSTVPVGGDLNGKDEFNKYVSFVPSLTPLEGLVTLLSPRFRPLHETYFVI
jgi:hypothetical protein